MHRQLPALCGLCGARRKATHWRTRPGAAAPAGAAPREPPPVPAPGRAQSAPRSATASRSSRARSGAATGDGWESGPPRAKSPSMVQRSAAAPQRGVRAWVALLVLVAVMILGIVVDGMRGQQLGTGFDLGIILG